MEFSTVDTFLPYYERIRGRTLRVAACIPRESLEWTYRAGKFTLGDLLRHLAGIERYLYAETVRFRPGRYPGHERVLADGYDAVFAYVARLHAESMEIFRTLSAADLQRKCLTPMGTPITVWKWLRAMVEHEVHHRGQLYLYLGHLGVETPPLFGLTWEEVRAKTPG